MAVVRNIVQKELQLLCRHTYLRKQGVRTLLQNQQCQHTVTLCRESDIESEVAVLHNDTAVGNMAIAGFSDQLLSSRFSTVLHSPLMKASAEPSFFNADSSWRMSLARSWSQNSVAIQRVTVEFDVFSDRF